MHVKIKRKVFKIIAKDCGDLSEGSLFTSSGMFVKESHYQRPHSESFDQFLDDANAAASALMYPFRFERFSLIRRVDVLRND